MVMQGEMVVAYDSKTLTTSLYAYLSIIELPLELPEEIVDGCQAVTGGCPVFAGELRSINAQFTVNTTLSGIDPDIELSIVNEDNVRVMCVRTAVQL